MRGATAILATAAFAIGALLAASAGTIAKADGGCFEAWQARQAQSACRGRSCADAGHPRRTPLKLPPWLMTRLASSAKPVAACATAALPGLRPAG